MRSAIKIAVIVIVVCALALGGFYVLSEYNVSAFAKEELERAEKAGLLKKVETTHELAQGRVKIDSVIADATDFTVFYSLKSWKGIGPNLVLVDSTGREFKKIGLIMGRQKGLVRFEAVGPDAEGIAVRIISPEGQNYDTPIAMDFSEPYQKAKYIKEGESKDLGNAVLTIDRLVLGTTKTFLEVSVTGKGEQTANGNYFLQMDRGLKDNQAFSPTIFIDGNQLESLGQSLVTAGGNRMKGYFSFVPVEGDVTEIKVTINNIPIAQEVDLGTDLFASDTVTINKKIPNGEGYFYLKKLFNTPTDNQTHIYYDSEGNTFGENIIASQFSNEDNALYEGNMKKLKRQDLVST